MSPSLPEPRQKQGTMLDRRKDPSIRTKVLFVVAVAISVIAAYAATQSTLTSRRLSGDENATCAIQRRGLPAGHDLAAGLAAEVTFLQQVIPHEALLAKGIRRSLQLIESDLGAYARIESKQPMTRTCHK